jgi:uncharacterized membrane protein YsdA (DUF1294 family)
VQRLTVLLLVALALASVLAFGMAVFDKFRARRRGRRIPEAALLWVALLGGSPGLVCGMLVARHKVRKPAFLGKLGLVVVVQAIALWQALSRGLL